MEPCHLAPACQDPTSARRRTESHDHGRWCARWWCAPDGVVACRAGPMVCAGRGWHVRRMDGSGLSGAGTVWAEAGSGSGSARIGIGVGIGIGIGVGADRDRDRDRGRTPDRDRGRDRGSGTVWVLAMMTLISFMTAASLLVGTARIARHRAEAAADLSALAGATQALAAPETACRRARDLAAANHASMTRCVVRGGAVDVRVKVRLVFPWFGEHSTFADSRAGPR